MKNKSKDSQIDSELEKLMAESDHLPFGNLTGEGSDQLFRFMDGFYDGLPTISDLNTDERALLLRLDMLISFRKSIGLDSTAQEDMRSGFLRYAISKNRKGRTESFNALSGTPKEHERKSFFGRNK